MRLWLDLCSDHTVQWTVYKVYKCFLILQLILFIEVNWLGYSILDESESDDWTNQQHLMWLIKLPLPVVVLKNIRANHINPLWYCLFGIFSIFCPHICKVFWKLAAYNVKKRCNSKVSRKCNVSTESSYFHCAAVCLRCFTTYLVSWVTSVKRENFKLFRVTSTVAMWISQQLS